MDRGVLTIGGPFKQCLGDTYLNGEHFKHGVLFIRGSLNLGIGPKVESPSHLLDLRKFSPCVQGWRQRSQIKNLVLLSNDSTFLAIFPCLEL